jgi:hypothetical protein
VGRVPEAKVSVPEFAISLCAAIASALTLAVNWHRADAARHGGAALAMAAAAALLLTPLFAPRTPPVGRACWCALLVLASIGGALTLAAPDWSWPALLLTATTAFAWSTVMAWAAALGADGAGGGAGESLRWSVLAVVLLLALAPLWAGPALVEIGSDSRLARALLAANPLVEVSSAAGYDVLRSPWFYRHSVLGSLRLRYPGPAEIALIDALLLLIPVLVPLRSWRRGPAYPKTHLETLL